MLALTYLLHLHAPPPGPSSNMAPQDVWLRLEQEEERGSRDGPRLHLGASQTCVDSSTNSSHVCLVDAARAELTCGRRVREVAEQVPSCSQAEDERREKMDGENPGRERETLPPICSAVTLENRNDCKCY